MRKPKLKISKKSFINFLGKLGNFTLKHPVELFVGIGSLLFASWLMLNSLSYSNGQILLHENIWSDFMSHIPLTRSFSLGDNVPPEAPLFAGERIKYHFLFYFIAGMLEKIGFSIDWAINIPSIIGLVGLMFCIYLITYKISKIKIAGLFAVLLFLFNSSFSWLYYFTDPASKFNQVTDIFTNTEFASFGPYDDKLVSAFWSWNVYINQRHLPFSFAVMFAAVWLIVYSKKNYLKALGVGVIAIMPILNKAMILILFILLGLHILGMKGQRLKIFALTVAGGVLAFPGLSYLSDAKSVGESGFRYFPGFIFNATTWKELKVSNLSLRWLLYWILNLGFLPVTAALGLLNTEKFKRLKFGRKILPLLDKFFADWLSPKKVWLFSAIIVFIIANNYVFATDVATNHKLINYVIIIFSIYSGVFLGKLVITKKSILAVVVLISLTLGGLLDMFPVINGGKVGWPDINQNKTSKWIVENTQPHDAFLNLTYEVSPISVTGRKIYFGWDYLNWSVGYDTMSRKIILQKIMVGELSKQEVCKFMDKNKLRYLFLNQNEKNFVERTPNFKYFMENFIAPDNAPDDLPTILYDRDKSCVL